MSTFLKSAQFSGTNGTHFHIDLYYTLNQSSENNTSTIKYDLYFVSTDGYSASGSAYNGYINGSWVGNGYSIGVNSQILVGSKTETYTHNSDGTKTVSYSGSLNTSWDIGNASLSGTLTLPKINRYVYLVSGTNFTDEENPVYTITNPDTTHPVRVKIEAGGNTQLITRDLAVGYSGTYTLELTTAERNTLRQLCTGQSMQIRETVCSMLGTTELNASYKDYTMTMVNATPTLTYTSTEQNANVISMLGSNDCSTVVANVSEVLFAYTPTVYKYATIINLISAEGVPGNIYQSYTLTTSPYQQIIDVTSGTYSGKFVHSLTDSRGYTTTIEDNQRTLLDYDIVRILSYSFKRQNQTSSNVIFNGEFYYWGNIGSYTNTPVVKYKLDDGSWVTIPSTNYTIDSQTHKLTITNYTISNVLPYTSQGQFSISIEDILTSKTDTSDNGKVLKGIPTFDYGEHDLKVNGDLYVADTDGDNAVSVLDEIEDAKIYANTYSTTETAIGKWINGETLYRKVLSFSTGSSAGDLGVNHNISNFGKLINIYGYLQDSSTNYFPIPSIYRDMSGSYTIAVYRVDDTKAVVTYGSNRTNKSGYLVLEYTKTS